jgi:amino-acid racemase
MKRIGLLGGMSWESSAEYYRFVNEAVRDRLGGLHSADCLLRSVDFAAIEALQRTGRWNEAGKLLAAEAQALAGGGAELLVLCTNTMHRVADQIAARWRSQSSTSLTPPPTPCGRGAGHCGAAGRP